MTEYIPACAVPTAKFPMGRTGTSAGYATHRRLGEQACPECLHGHNESSAKRRAGLSDEGKARLKKSRRQAAERYRKADHGLQLAAVKRYRERQKEIIRAAKVKPCADCGVQYPFYVMQFDHIDPSEKEFTIGSGRGGLNTERLLREISKCEVVCANCHAERTNTRNPARYMKTGDF